jgi:hypothetical protein
MRKAIAEDKFYELLKYEKNTRSIPTAPPPGALAPM